MQKAAKISHTNFRVTSSASAQNLGEQQEDTMYGNISITFLNLAKPFKFGKLSGKNSLSFVFLFLFQHLYFISARF